MSSPNDSAGRIHKDAFLASTLALFVLCLISVSGRFYIRIRVQREFSIDDGILLFGTACLVTAVVLLFQYVNKMYMVEAFIFGLPDAEASLNFVDDSFWYHKISAVALVLTWLSLVAVKFCFLFLFKKLVDRIRPMVIYWWVTAIFNAAVSAYGASVYIAACPYFYSFKSLQCGQGAGVDAAFNFSLSQMVLDIIGDLMILLIPCRLISKIKIRWTRKVALASSLCLTVVVIICTVLRIIGLRSGNKVDSVWETYWQYVAACTGLTMTAATAFRSLFISHQLARQKRPRVSDSARQWRLYAKVKQAVRRSFTVWSWRTPSKPSKASSAAGHPVHARDLELGRIEHGTITGLRSFIRGYGRGTDGASQVMRSQTIEEADPDDMWPLSKKVVTTVTSTSRKHDKMLINEGSGKYYKMLDREESGEHDKILAIPEKCRAEAMFKPDTKFKVRPRDYVDLPAREVDAERRDQS